MAGNTIRDEQKTKLSTGMMSLGNLERVEHENEEEVIVKNTNTKNPFLLIAQYLDIEKVVGVGVPVRYLPHILFLTLLGVLHIGNVHYSDRIAKEQAQLKAEIEEFRADYTTLKAGYMFKSKKTEVAKRVEHLGITQGKRPPYKIVIQKSER